MTKIKNKINKKKKQNKQNKKAPKQIYLLLEYFAVKQTIISVVFHGYMAPT